MVKFVFKTSHGVRGDAEALFENYPLTSGVWKLDKELGRQIRG